MELLFGLLTAIAVAYGETSFATANEGILIHDLTCFFIIPIPAILLGMVASSGVPLFLYARQMPITCRPILSAVACALIAFFGTYYGLYRSTYVSGGDINFQGRGLHISQYEFNDMGEAITFPRYFTEMVVSSSSTFYFRGRPVGSVSSPIWSWVKFIIIGAGYSFGALGVIGLLAEMGYCKDCGKYRTKKKLRDLNWEDWLKMRQSIPDAPMDPNALANQTLISMNARAKLTMHYCRSCKSGVLKVKPEVSTKKGRKEIDKLEEEIQIGPDFVSSNLS